MDDTLHQRVEPARTPRLALRIASLAVLALGWELLAHRLGSLLLPTFSQTVIALARLIVTRQLWQAVWVSNQAMALGFLFAAAAGILLGLFLGRWQAAERMIDPYLSILLAIPKAALIPIVIMAVGIGLPARVLIVFVSAVAAITINVRAGLRTLDPAWIEMARSFGATEAQLWRKVLLRGALPGILTGLRLGLARSIKGMVSIELLLVALGIGRLVLWFQGTFEMPSLYATVLVVVAEAALLLRGCRWLEKRLVPRVGAVGAAATTAVTAWLVAIATMIAVYRCCQAGPGPGTIVRVLVATAVAYALAGAWQAPGIWVIPQLLVLCGVVLLLLFVLGEVTARDLSLARSLLRHLRTADDA